MLELITFEDLARAVKCAASVKVTKRGYRGEFNGKIIEFKGGRNQPCSIKVKGKETRTFELATSACGVVGGKWRIQQIN